MGTLDNHQQLVENLDIYFECNVKVNKPRTLIATRQTLPIEQKLERQNVEML